MIPKYLLTAVVLFSALTLVFGQSPGSNGIFTSAQADAGRVAYGKTCGRCHTPTLLGRQGNPDERPAVDSLSAAD